VAKAQQVVTEKALPGEAKTVRRAGQTGTSKGSPRDIEMISRKIPGRLITKVCLAWWRTSVHQGRWGKGKKEDARAWERMKTAKA